MMTVAKTYQGYYFVIAKQVFFVVTDRVYKTRSLYQQVLRHVLELKGVEVTTSHLEDPRLLDEISYYLHDAPLATITVLEDHYNIINSNMYGGWRFDAVHVFSLDR